MVGARFAELLPVQASCLPADGASVAGGSAFISPPLRGRNKPTLLVVTLDCVHCSMSISLSTQAQRYTRVDNIRNVENNKNKKNRAGHTDAFRPRALFALRPEHYKESQFYV